MNLIPRAANDTSSGSADLALQSWRIVPYRVRRSKRLFLSGTFPKVMTSKRTLPSLTSLQFFDAAVRHMSFTLAARELNVTQSAVSRQIRQLEDFVGRPLFRRHKQRLDPDRARRSLLGCSSRPPRPGRSRNSAGDGLRRRGRHVDNRLAAHFRLPMVGAAARRFHGTAS